MPAAVSVSLDASCPPPFLIRTRTHSNESIARAIQIFRATLSAMASSGPPGSAVGKAETHELADFRETAPASRTSRTASVSTTEHSQGSNVSHVLQDTASSASTVHASSEEAGPADEAQVPEPSQL